MRLDRTRIAISERSQVEILDLTFLVLREFFMPVVASVLVLAVPLALLNHFMIRWMVADFIEELPVWRYIWVMTVLVYVEAPFASIFATSYLGKVTFFEQPTRWAMIRDIYSLGGRLFWTQLVLRGLLLVVVLVWLIPPEDASSPIEWTLPFICLGLFLLRSLRPYINEIVLLERSPIWSRKKDEITIGKRSNRLHGPNSGDLFGRGIALLPVAITLGGAIFGLFWFIIATFSNDWSFGPAIVYFAIPAMLWMLAIYMTVFRFLSYLDLRIRREGWEVELKMRAEANRLTGRMALGKS